MTISTLPHLADADFVRHTPSPFLQPYVCWYWQMLTSCELEHSRQEFMHANGSVLITFNYGETLELDHGNIRQGIQLSSPSSASRLLTMSGKMSCFGIVLKPGAAYSLFGIPAHAVSDLQEQNVPSALCALYDKLATLENFTLRVIEAEKALISLLNCSEQHIPPAISASIAQLDASKGVFSIRQLMDSINLSQRQLERQFKDHLGLTAKQYARISRIAHARDILKQSPVDSLADVAVQTGFFDQSHFHRDFISVVGMPPNKYRKRFQINTLHKQLR